jgi:hypothetical protein
MAFYNIARQGYADSAAGLVVKVIFFGERHILNYRQIPLLGLLRNEKTFRKCSNSR